MILFQIFIWGSPFFLSLLASFGFPRHESLNSYFFFASFMYYLWQINKLKKNWNCTSICFWITWQLGGDFNFKGHSFITNWSACRECGSKKKIWVPERNETHDLLNTRQTLYPLSNGNSWRERSLTEFIWQMSCILLGSALSRSSWVWYVNKDGEFLAL